MPYKIWFGSARTSVEFQSMRRHWVARQRNTLHDALWDAMMIEGSGSEQVWEIAGDDGTRLGRPKLLDMIRQKRETLIANPPQSESETTMRPYAGTVPAPPASAAPLGSNGSHKPGMDASSLRAWRDSSGLSLDGAADLLGVNPLTLLDLENGRAPGSALWGPISRIVALVAEKG